MLYASVSERQVGGARLRSRTVAYGYFDSSSLKNVTARSSPVCPSQKIACLRTSALAWVLAISINSGTASSLERWLMAKTACFWTSVSASLLLTVSPRTFRLRSPAFWPSQKIACFYTSTSFSLVAILIRELMASSCPVSLLPLTETAKTNCFFTSRFVTD